MVETEVPEKGKDDVVNNEYHNRKMFMVITLKSGTQLRLECEEYTVSTNKLSEAIIGIRWVSVNGNIGVWSISYLDFLEIAAVHSEYELI